MKWLLSKIKEWHYWTFINPRPYLVSRSVRDILSNPRTAEKLHEAIEKERARNDNEGVELDPELQEIIGKYPRNKDRKMK